MRVVPPAECGAAYRLRTRATAGASRKIFRSGSCSGNEFASRKIVARLESRRERAASRFPASSSMWDAVAWAVQVANGTSSHGGGEALGEASIYLALTRLPRGASQLGLGVFTRYRRNLDQLMPRMSKRLHLPRLSLNTRTSNMRVNTMSLRVPAFWHAGSDWAAIGGNTSCQGPPLACPACAYFPPWRNFESQWIALNQCMARQHWPRPTTSWKELAPPDKSAPGRRPGTRSSSRLNER
jgi:hypothetical protein